MSVPQGIASLHAVSLRLRPPDLILLSGVLERTQARLLAVRLRAHACVERNASLPARVEAAVEIVAQAHREDVTSGGESLRRSPAPIREVSLHA